MLNAVFEKLMAAPVYAKLCVLALCVVVLFGIARIGYFGVWVKDFSERLVPVEIPIVDAPRALVAIRDVQVYVLVSCGGKQAFEIGRSSDIYYEHDELLVDINVPAPVYLAYYIVAGSKTMMSSFVKGAGTAPESPEFMIPDERGRISKRLILDDQQGAEFHVVVAAPNMFDHRAVGEQIRKAVSRLAGKGERALLVVSGLQEELSYRALVLDKDPGPRPDCIL